MSQLLEVAIGLVLAFTVVSLGVSVIVEWLSAMLAMRGKLLWKGIGRMVGKSWEDALCAHPILQALTRRTWFDALFPYLGRAKPSYVPAKTFSAALLGVIQDSNPGAQSQPLAQAVAAMPQGSLKLALQPLVDQAGADIKQAQANIEHWFDTSMDRVTGWYKRWSQLVLFLLGLGVACWFGIDTIEIGQALWTDEDLRDEMVQVADIVLDSQDCQNALSAPSTGNAAVDAESSKKARACLEASQDRLAAVSLPLVPFPKPAGKARPALPADTTSIARWVRGLPGWARLLAVVFAALLLWLDFQVRGAGPKKSSSWRALLVRALTLGGRVLVVLAVALGAAGLLAGVVARFQGEGFTAWLGPHLLGFVLTAVAVSFGAPFWFDLLGRLVKLRTSGTRPEPPKPGEPTAASPKTPGR